MGRDAFADRETVLACLAVIESASARLADCSFDGLSTVELVEVLTRRETLAWQAPVIDHRILARLATEGHDGALGACSLVKGLAERLRISGTEARRRVDEAADLGPRTTLGGQPLPARLPALAAAQAAGHISGEHVVIARKAHAKIPTGVSAADRERAEADLAELATQFDPPTFARLAAHLILNLNPDGDYTDKERQARRGVRIGRQGADGMSTLSGYITPELRATLEPVLAKLAAPGMANSADEHPCVSGIPTQAQITDDDRTVAQRNHDALLAAVRAVLACGDLGQLNGLPVTVIVSTTLAELQAAAHPDTAHPAAASSPAGAASSPAETPITGKAHTGGGSLLPMGDLLRMAAHAYHYLTIFDGQGRALWLGRTKRIASADQRIVLHARDRGCTRPGCPVSGYLCQAHHTDKDWANGGHTDIDDLTLACPPDNNIATTQGFTTRLGTAGRVEWIPPPHLDHNQPRINPFHFIEAVIAHHRQRPIEVADPDPPPGNPQQPPPPPDDTRPENTRLNDSWPDDTRPNETRPDNGWFDDTWPDDGWPDDPLPGDPGYDDALDDLQRSYDAMNLDELARLHFNEDWLPVA